MKEISKIFHWAGILSVSDFNTYTSLEFIIFRICTNVFSNRLPFTSGSNFSTKSIYFLFTWPASTNIGIFSNSLEFIFVDLSDVNCRDVEWKFMSTIIQLSRVSNRKNSNVIDKETHRFTFLTHLIVELSSANA